MLVFAPLDWIFTEYNVNATIVVSTVVIGLVMIAYGIMLESRENDRR